MDPERLPKFLAECRVSADEALRRTVRSGTTILTGFASSEPTTFYSGVWDFILREKIRDVRFKSGLLLTPHRLFVGNALKQRGVLPNLAKEAREIGFSIVAQWAREINATTRRIESLASLMAHYKRLEKRHITFTSGFMSPPLNGVVPDTAFTRMMHPDRIGRNTSRMGITDMQFVHFSDAGDALAFDYAGAPRFDAFVAVMTPPDADGEMSHGPAAAFNGEVVEHLAERCDADLLLYVNDGLPFTTGLPDAPNTLNVGRLERLAASGRLRVVMDDGALPALPPGSFDHPLPTELAIADSVVDHIEANIEQTRGRAIQVGFGGTGVLAIRKLLDSSWTGRAYTEMLETFMLDLLESGKIAGSHIVERDGRRTMLDGKLVCTFTLGMQGSDFYKRIDRNPAIVLAPSSRVVIPEAFFGGLGINNCLAVDFNGHVNTSARDKNHYSGVGGGAAILRGLARGGISYLCMKSTHTTPDGELRSSIFPFMPKGTPICYTGPDLCGGREGALSYLVTEHGVARLSQTSQAELIRALISVAHPRFRGLLKRAAWQEYRVRV